MLKGMQASWYSMHDPLLMWIPNKNHAFRRNQNPNEQINNGYIVLAKHILFYIYFKRERGDTVVLWIRIEIQPDH
jgi:hypothetical protein